MFIVFTKGEIIMNNIYKVIWSKAKNCYVVASEIARSHTKSATGSEKIGGVTRRSLLASLMALSLLCGGFGVATAADAVRVDESSTPSTAAEVYTKAGVDTLLNGKANTSLDNLSEAGKSVIKTTMADELAKKADATALDGKADKTYVDQKLTEAGTNVDTKLAAYAKTTEVVDKIAAEATARDTAITAAIAQERNDRDAAINTAINGEVTNRNQAIDNAIAQEVTDRNAAVTNAKTELQNKITAEETARTNADNAFNNRLTTAEGKIDANKTAIGELKTKDTELEGKITTLEGSGVKYDTAVKDKITLAGAGGTTITNLKDAALNESSTDAVTGKQLNKTNENLAAEVTARTNKDTELEEKITKNSGDITDLKAKDTELEGKIQTNANNIQANANDIAATNKRTAGIDRIDATRETTIEGNVTVDSVGNVKAKGDVTADGKLTGKGVDAGAGDITTTGAVNAGSLNVENASQLKGDVTMDKTLSVTGDTKLKKTDVDGTLNVTGESSLKNTKVDGTLTTTGKATFKEAVEMDKGLTVTNGATTLKGTTVDGALNVTGESSLKNTQVDGTLSVNKETTLNGTLTAKGEAKFEKNVTIEKDLTVNGKLNVGEIAMENKKTDADGTIHNSSTTITADGITHHGEVKKSGVTTESQFTHTEKGSETYAKKGDTTDWTETRSDVTADGVKTEAKDSKGNRTNTSQTAEGINGSATDKDGNKTYTKVTATENSFQIQDKDGKNKNHQVNTKDSSVTEITNAAGATTKTEQTAKDITNIAEQGTIKNDAKNIENNASGNIKNTAQNGTITNDAKDIVNNATGDMTNTVGGKLTTTVTGQATENFNGGLDTNVTGTENHTVTGDQNIHVTGKQTNKIDGDQVNTIGGNQTTTVTGNISNKAENITNEASNSITDKVGDHTRVLDSDGITDTVGGSTFKQRIDKIMMESKDVSIKAEETLTNEAKVITNKASEVINNEAVNINNTATGIITSKASEIKNQADKLISNKVGENTWENMENGKITTSIKDGAKQNLTQSDAAGTTQSTVDGNKSTVTIQNADGLTDAVRDGAGNENGSVATATTSANTIKSGSKANTVISTADGTSFINSEAAAPVTGESGAGTAVNTTIKGNTITTGKVTMDYAEVMKDLGVRGNANITGKTTTGSLEVTGTSTLKGDVTMGSSATVKKDLTVEGNTNLKNTKVDGTLDVTQKATFGDSVSIAKDLSVDGNATIKGDVTAKSYKVGEKTYIDENGINANDQKITNVADGSISEGSKDAVNGGQLYTVKNDLEGKVNKVGANAAAMANLHPMEFDPDSKWNIAAAIGNYGSETAAALGAFYRPNDDVMVNLSTAFGTGENMVGGGVSVRLGKGSNKLSREENNALKAQVADLSARMDALLSVLNPNMSKDFPDVPENHWAYEAVSRLAGNDIVQGYPDGEFHGERTMTRYEMAEIIYNALSRGAEAERELVEEFKPELQAMAASEKATAEKAEG